jgi:hypothetical protein
VTPVLIWADLPPQVRLKDDAQAQNRNGPFLPSDVRCQARSRGDTAIANMRDVPLEGGYRCQRRAKIEGLCLRHFRAADPAVRCRAAELAKATVLP